MSATKSSSDQGKRDEKTTEATMSSASEITVADAIESDADILRVLRDELAANDTVVETTWTRDALRGQGAALDVSEVNTAIALAITTIPAPVNDDGYVGEFELGRGAMDALDVEAMLRADDEFALRCDELREAWLARVENEEDTHDE